MEGGREGRKGKEPKTKGLVGHDDGCRNDLDHLNGNMREIGSRAFKEPFVSSAAFLSVDGHVTDSSKAEGAVGFDHSERSDGSN